MAGGPGLAAPDTGPLLDAAARNTCRRRIRELDSELAAADRAGDSTAAEQAHQEPQALIGELRRATGLAGHPRRATDDAERARVNVTRTLRAAINRITAAARGQDASRRNCPKPDPATAGHRNCLLHQRPPSQAAMTLFQIGRAPSNGSFPG